MGAKPAHETEEIIALIRRCLHGEQSAFAQLYDNYATGVYRLCYSLLMNQQDAEDVTQETFVYAFKSLSRYDSRRAAFKTWLYTIAVSRCRNTYRRKHLPQINLSQLFHNTLTAPAAERPEAVMAERAAQDALATALAQLSAPLREAIVLRYGHGLTYREIAEVMHCPPKTAESRVRLAHDRLRGALESTGKGLLEELLSLS